MSGRSIEPSTHKVRQRAIASCAACYKSKIKCDKVFPCSACTKRGLGFECAQAVVRGEIMGGRPDSAPRTISAEELRVENHRLRQRLAAYERDPSSIKRSANAVQSPSTSSREFATDMAHDLFDIGRHLQSVSDSPYLGPRNTPASDSSALTIPSDAWSREAMLSLVPFVHSHRLVQYHFDHVFFLHCTFDRSVVDARHTAWLADFAKGDLGDSDWEWLSLYFAIIASAMYLMTESEAADLGWSPSAASAQMRIWAAACVSCITRSDYLSRPKLEGLQGICVFAAIGHAFDYTNLLRFLLHVALKMAQDMHMHLLPPEKTGTETLPAGFAQRELGRRIWVNLTIAETLTPIAFDPRPLIYPASETCLPLNIDGDKLHEAQTGAGQPWSVQTDVTYITMLGRIAEVYRHYHLTTAVADVEERYSVLQSCIQMLGEVFDDCPQLSETDPSYDFGAIASQEEYMLAWQRYSLTTTVYLSRLQFCRPFFVRAYSQPEFVMSRVVCIESAFSMINIHNGKNRLPENMTKLVWLAMGVTVAGSFLLIELTRGDSTPEVRAQLEEAIDLAITWLEARADQHTFARRGAESLKAMSSRTRGPEAPAASEFDWDDESVKAFLRDLGLE